MAGTTNWKTGQSGYAREAVVIETDDQIVEVGVTHQDRIDLIVHNRASECSDAFDDLTARMSSEEAGRVVAALIEAGAAGPVVIDAALASPRADSDERTAGVLWSAWSEDDCDSDPRIDPMAQKVTEWFVGRWPVGAEEPECRILIGAGRSAEIIARRIAEKLTSVLNTDAIVARKSATPAQPAGAVPDGLGALSEAATPGPWAATYQEYDDWGVIRTTVENGNGFHPVVCSARVMDDEQEQAAARRENRQPRICGANASLIVAAVNRLREEIASHPAGQRAEGRCGAHPECGCYAEGKCGERTPPDSPLTGPVGTEEDHGLLGQVSSEQAEAFERTARNLTNLYAPDGPPALRQGILAALLRVHLAARPAAPEAQGTWRFDMEAAPRDGKWFYGAINRPHENVIPFRWSQRQFDRFGNGWDFRGDGLLTPYAWHPMLDAPAPPASSGQRGR